MRTICILAGALVLLGPTAQAQDIKPSAVAIFEGKSPQALADEIRAACRNHGFETQIRNPRSLICLTTGLAFPKDGRLAAHGNGGHSDMDSFTFALEPSGDGVVVFEKTRHAVEMPLSSAGSKLSEAARAREDARVAEVQRRLERFLTELGGVLQPPPE